MEEKYVGVDAFIDPESVERIAMNYTFGQQRAVFAEECAEAIQAVCKLERDQSPEKYSKAMAALISEVADVLIMAQQMRFFLGKEKVDDEIRRKVERQLRRIRGEEND